VKPPEQTPVPQPTTPNSTLLSAPPSKTVDLFGPTPTPTAPSNLFSNLEINQSSAQSSDTKAIKNEIKGLFDIATPMPYAPQGQNLGLLFGPQNGQFAQTQFGQYPQYNQPQFYPQVHSFSQQPQQQVFYQQSPLSYQQPQLYQQPSHIQQQDAFDLLNKIQSKSTASSTPLF
jgi:hypothetical protein